MQPSTLYPDAVLLVINYLRAVAGTGNHPLLDGVIFASRVPEVRPAKFVTVRRNGGVSDEAPTLDAPRMDIQVWANDEGEAQDIAALCSAIIFTMPTRSPVTKVEGFLGLTEIPDPLSNQSRYLFTVTLTIRGVPFNL